MLTRQEGERLAQAINALRPDWPLASLITVIAKRRDRPYLDLALELTFVALDPESKSPARVDHDGPWKKLRTGSVATQTYRTVSVEECIVCGFGGGWALHGEKDHPFTNPLLKRKSTPPTPDQRAAIDKAIADAKHAAAAAKEEQPPRERRDMNDVINSHTDRTDAA